MRVGGARAPLDLMKRKRHTGEEIIKKLREANPCQNDRVASIEARRGWGAVERTFLCDR
jgi:hypothetical protein